MSLCGLIPFLNVLQHFFFAPEQLQVLTWILRDSLIGNSKTVMLAALSPAAANYQETLSTLRFAQQAKQLKTKAIVSEGMRFEEVSRYMGK